MTNARAASTESPFGPSHSGFSKKVIRRCSAAAQPRRARDVPPDRRAAVADGDADLLDADRLEERQRPFEQALPADRRQAVRDAVLADRDPLAGGQNERACDHAARQQQSNPPIQRAA